jgi:replication factor C large subunit
LQTLSPEGSLAYSDKQFYSSDAALETILSSDSLDQALPKMRDFDAAPLDKIRAIYAAVISSKSLSDEEKADSLKLLSFADIIWRRISKTQNWRLLRYLDKFLLVASIGKGLRPSDSAIPWNLKLAIWNDGRVVKELLADMPLKFHIGKGAFASYYLPYLSLYLKHQPAAMQAFIEREGYDETERRVLAKIAPRI